MRFFALYSDVESCLPSQRTTKNNMPRLQNLPLHQIRNNTRNKLRKLPIPKPSQRSRRPPQHIFCYQTCLGREDWEVGWWERVGDGIEEGGVLGSDLVLTARRVLRWGGGGVEAV
jgi:hypothetical protein